jgi:uncharacterized protein (DUF433 family)
MAITYEITSDAPPLRRDATGVIRIAETRVTLDTVIDAFNAGATPEEIAIDYPSLSLNAIYGTISHYLNHKAEVDEYLTRREVEAAQIRLQIESRQPMAEFRERLFARAKTMGIR